MTNHEQRTTTNESETFRLGERLAGGLVPGDMMLLRGPLGAGKSVLARGIASGLGEQRWRGSPTFSLVHEYATTPPLIHIDLYRLSGEESGDLGLEDYAGGSAILVVEWADRAEEYLRSIADRPPIEVEIDHAGGDRRRVMISRGVESKLPTRVEP